MKPTLTVTQDLTGKVLEALRAFKRDAVLVGIPESDAARTNAEGDEQVNNAYLLALNNFGSEAQGIPPRPVLEIGLRKAQPEITEQFRQAVIKAFATGAAAINTYYNRAGIIASNSVKKVINAQEGFAPPAAATLAARRAHGFRGTKALIVTGQMRNAITYVLNTGTK